MKGVTLHALLVTGEPDSSVGVAAALASARDPRVITTVTSTLDGAHDSLSGSVPDAVLLDLRLPDPAPGVALLRSMLPGTPILALTPPAPGNRGMELVRAGVDDFLDRNADEETVVCAVAVAVERAGRDTGTSRDLVARSREQDRAELDRLAPRPTTDLTGATLGQGMLGTRLPGEYRRLRIEYAAILDDSLEELVLRVDRRVATRLRALADDLGRLGAGPRDVVELHTATVEQRGRDAPPARARALLEEGRLVVLQLMGDLVAYYRRNALMPLEPTARVTGEGGTDRTQASR